MILEWPVNRHHATTPPMPTSAYSASLFARRPAQLSHLLAHPRTTVSDTIGGCKPGSYTDTVPVTGLGGQSRACGRPFPPSIALEIEPPVNELPLRTTSRKDLSNKTRVRRLWHSKSSLVCVMASGLSEGKVSWCPRAIVLEMIHNPRCAFRRQSLTRLNNNIHSLEFINSRC